MSPTSACQPCRPPERQAAPSLAGPRPLPYFSAMKHMPLWLTLALMLCCGCTIDEVGEQSATGTLVFRAENLHAPGEAVSGILEISGHSPSSLLYSGVDSLLTVDDLPLDVALTLNFTPNDGSWYPTEPVHFSLDSAHPSLTHILRLTAQTDSTLSVMVRTTSAGMELPGMPLWLDGVRWPQDSPATLHFSAGATHLLEVANETCTRASTSFSYSSNPGLDLVLDLPVTTMSVQDVEPETRIVVDGVDQGGGDWDLTNPSARDYFVSAWRPGYRAEPAAYSLDGFCGEDATFNWIANPEGYAAGQLFPDFNLEQVVPGQSEPIGEFSLRQLRGRVVLMTFWYITCVNCQLEMPGFQNLLDEYYDRGFRVVAMDPYASDDAALFPDFDFIFLRDVGSPPVAQMAQVGAFPTNFIVLPDGRIHSVRGGMSEEVLENLLLELLPE